MDHQQNYEYSDSNAFGFINSFSSTDNFMLGQPHQGQQQLNGKSHSELPLLAPSFDSANSVPSPQYNAPPQTMLYHLPDSLVASQQTSPNYPPATIDFQHISAPDMSISSSKDSMFNLIDPPAAVPVDIIQDIEPTIIQPTQTLQPSDLLSIAETSTVTSQLETQITDQIQEHNEQPERNVKTFGKQPIFNPDQSSMLKALGVVRKGIQGSGSKKRRRRILQLNEEDSDDDTELKKQLLDDSLEKEKEISSKNETADDSSDSNDSSLGDDPSALKARSLLKSAVIIQGPESKKKKKRVLESDDEDDMQTSVDDIGLIEVNEGELEDETLKDDIIVGETVFETSENGETVVSIENPVIIQEESIDLPASLPPKTNHIEDNSLGREDVLKSDAISKAVEEEQKELKQEVKNIVKAEDGEIDPSMSVEAILENIKPMADDDEFFKADDKSDDSDVQFVSNEDYFGTPDNTKLHSTGNRSKGSKGSVRRTQSQNSNQRKRSNKYEKDFVEGSSESEDTSYSESSASSSESSGAENIRQRARLPGKKSPIIVQTKSFSVTTVPIRRKVVKKDRFYDKSRDIPNDVYFGDVKVPLHVLHTRWDSDAESSDSSSNNHVSQTKCINPNRFNNFSSSNISRPSFNYIDQSDDPKLSTLKEFAKMSGIKVNYARLFNGIRSTDDKCMLIRRILAQKGLQGEPTTAKCKQLRLDLQAKRESAELDKSLIIRSEGRTRRATRNVSSKSPFSTQPSTSSAVVQPETLQTLSKIRRVVDSDSE